MAITWEIYPQYELTVFRFVGEITLDENVQTVLDYLNSDDFEPDFVVLTDLSRSSYSGSSFDSLCQLSYRLRHYYAARTPGKPTAFYSPNDVNFGVARQFEVAAEPYINRPVGVFRTLQDCMEHLGFQTQDSDLLKLISVSKASDAE